MDTPPLELSSPDTMYPLDLTYPLSIRRRIRILRIREICNGYASKICNGYATYFFIIIFLYVSEFFFSRSDNFFFDT